jgi:hypothetical protein
MRVSGLKKLFLGLCIFIIPSFLFGGWSGKDKLDCRLCGGEIIIDGSRDEWKDTARLEKENMDIGICNDGEFLYVMLEIRSERIIEQIMKFGFTTWFDPQFEKERRFGIHYPLGDKEQEEKSPKSMFDYDKNRPDEKQSSLSYDLEIINSAKNEPITMKLAKARGLEVKFKEKKGVLVYELKVPLSWRESHPYAIRFIEGNPLDIGFETPALDKNSASKFESSFSRGGTHGGRMSRWEARENSTSDNNRVRNSSNMKIWLVVQLSSVITEGIKGRE